MITRGIVLNPEQSIDLEPDPTILYDLSRYKNNGTMKGSGEPNAVQLPSGLWVWHNDGTDDRIVVPDSPSMRPAIYMTLNVWVYNINQVDYAGIVMKGGAGQSTGYRLRSTTGTTIGFYAHDGTWRVASKTMPAGAWYMLTGVCDSVGIKLYVNGASPATGVYTGPITHDAKDVWIGNDEDYAAARVWNGYIGEISIYNYPLDAGQILAHYKSTKWLYGVFD